MAQIMPGSHRSRVCLTLQLGAAAFCDDVFATCQTRRSHGATYGLAQRLTAVLFVMGKFVLGLYLGSGAAGSAYGAASSLITLLLWIYYSAQILLFGAQFTQVYANTYGTHVEAEGAYGKSGENGDRGV